MGEAEKVNGKKKKLIIAAAAVLLILVLLILFLIFRSQITATTMRILRIEGTVSLEENGKEKNIRKDLRLKSGNALITAAESLVSIGLDDTKIVTLNENSRAEFEQKSRKLNLKLTAGSLFFDVSKPLEEDESFEIRTSTMVVGIRGTSGIVSVEGENETLTVTDGHVHVTGTNPVTGEIKEIEVYAGQKIVVYLYNDREVDSIEFSLEEVTEHDLPQFVLNYLRENLETLDRVVAATGWSRPWILGLEGDRDGGRPAMVADNTAGGDKKPESGADGTAENPAEGDPAGGTMEDNGEPAGEGAGEGGDGAGRAEGPAAGEGAAGEGRPGAAAPQGAPAPQGTAAPQPENPTPLTPEALKTAREAIVVTNPDNGLVLLKDGTLLDPAYYAAANADVVEKYGTSTEGLVLHYITHGKGEGRPPLSPTLLLAKAPEPQAPNYDPNAGGSSGSSHDDDDDDDDDDDHSSGSSSSKKGSSSSSSSSSSSTTTSSSSSKTTTSTSSGGGENDPGVTPLGDGIYQLSDTAGYGEIRVGNDGISIISDEGNVNLPLKIGGTTYNEITKVDLGSNGSASIKFGQTVVSRNSDGYVCSGANYLKAKETNDKLSLYNDDSQTGPVGIEINKSTGEITQYLPH